jgi:hypothetical protein
MHFYREKLAHSTLLILESQSHIKLQPQEPKDENGTLF